MGADEVATPLLWSKWFLQEQGYKILQAIMYQDNKSAMLLEKNGKESSSKRTRHINIRYFYITDCIARGEFTVQYCPTDDMWADLLTKPLQGAKFLKFRQILMNHGSNEQVEQKAQTVEQLLPGSTESAMLSTTHGNNKKRTVRVCTSLPEKEGTRELKKQRLVSVQE